MNNQQISLYNIINGNNCIKSDAKRQLSLFRKQNQSLTTKLKRFHKKYRQQHIIKWKTFASSSSSSSDPKWTGMDIERSNLVNEELLIFLFQLELDTEMQRAMNYEQFEVARNIRSQREKIDEYMYELQSKKGQGSGSKEMNTGSEVSDITSEGLKLRYELQQAISEERYDDAAKYRDQLTKLENLVAINQENTIKLDFNNPLFRLGQRFTHKTKGYRGVICGWDHICCETEEWKNTSELKNLINKEMQPFYHVLVDQRDWPEKPNLTSVAYVAQEYIDCPELNEKTWKDEYGNDPLIHPFLNLLFLGPDYSGDLIPCSQLRNKYHVNRRDVYPGGDDNT